MLEDPDYTNLAMSYVITFEDVLHLPDIELDRLLAETPTRITAYAIYSANDEIKNRFLAHSRPRAVAEIREYFGTPNVTPIQIGGGQLKMIEITRKLEKRGIIKTKKVP